MSDFGEFLLRLKEAAEEDETVRDAEKPPRKSKGREKRVTHILPEACIMRLQEVAPRYIGKKCPFKVGDIVTPCEWTTLRSKGEPSIVVEVREDTDYLFAGEPASNTCGRLPNIRTITVMDEYIVTHWVEAAEFQLWKSEG